MKYKNHCQVSLVSLGIIWHQEKYKVRVENKCIISENKPILNSIKLDVGCIIQLPINVYYLGGTFTKGKGNSSHTIAIKTKRWHKCGPPPPPFSGYFFQSSPIDKVMQPLWCIPVFEIVVTLTRSFWLTRCCENHRSSVKPPHCMGVYWRKTDMQTLAEFRSDAYKRQTTNCNLGVNLQCNITHYRHAESCLWQFLIFRHQVLHKSRINHKILTPSIADSSLSHQP